MFSSAGRCLESQIWTSPVSRQGHPVRIDFHSHLPSNKTELVGIIDEVKDNCDHQVDKRPLCGERCPRCTNFVNVPSYLIAITRLSAWMYSESGVVDIHVHPMNAIRELFDPFLACYFLC